MGELWRKYGSKRCFESFEEHNAFSKDKNRMAVVRFKNFAQLENRSLLKSSASGLCENSIANMSVSRQRTRR